MMLQEFGEPCHLLRGRYPRGVLVAELTRNQHLVIGLASSEIFLIFALQHSRILREAVGVDVGHAEQRSSGGM